MDVTPPTIVYHVGVKSVTDTKRWMSIVREQMAFLQGHEIYLGLHGTPEHERVVRNIATTWHVRIKKLNRYEDDLWEVPTLKWIHTDILPELKEDDIVLYMHTKGAANPTGPLGNQDTIRHYLMDQLVGPMRVNVERMNNERLDTLGCFGVSAHGKALSGIYFMNFWYARVRHLRSLGMPNDTTRYDAEWYMRWNVDTAGFIERTVAVCNTDLDRDCMEHAPFRYLRGDKWAPSEETVQRLNEVQPDNAAETTAADDSPHTSTSKTEPWMIAVPVTLGVLLLLAILYIRFRPL